MLSYSLHLLFVSLRPLLPVCRSGRGGVLAYQLIHTVADSPLFYPLLLFLILHKFPIKHYLESVLQIKMDPALELALLIAQTAMIINKSNQFMQDIPRSNINLDEKLASVDL